MSIPKNMTRVLIALGVMLAVGLMMVCLWTWQLAPHLMVDADRPDTILWAVRTAAVAAGALAQTVLLVLVVGNIYRTRIVDLALRWMTAGVFAISLVSAIALGLAGR